MAVESRIMFYKTFFSFAQCTTPFGTVTLCTLSSLSNHLGLSYKYFAMKATWNVAHCNTLFSCTCNKITQFCSRLSHFQACKLLNLSLLTIIIQFSPPCTFLSPKQRTKHQWISVALNKNKLKFKNYMYSTEGKNPLAIAAQISI